MKQVILVAVLGLFSLNASAQGFWHRHQIDRYNSYNNGYAYGHREERFGDRRDIRSNGENRNFRRENNGNNGSTRSNGNNRGGYQNSNGAVSTYNNSNSGYQNNRTNTTPNTTSQAQGSWGNGTRGGNSSGSRR